VRADDADEFSFAFLGGDDEWYGPIGDAEGKTRLNNFYQSWDDRRPSDVDAYLSALTTVVEQREREIDAAIEGLQRAARNCGEHLPQCRQCGSSFMVDDSIPQDTVIVSTDFVRRGVSMPRIIRCSDVNNCSAESLMFSPLYVGYFPANPVKQVCERK
jgi:hypothetical protein